MIFIPFIPYHSDIIIFQIFHIQLTCNTNLIMHHIIITIKHLIRSYKKDLHSKTKLNDNIGNINRMFLELIRLKSDL